MKVISFTLKGAPTAQCRTRSLQNMKLLRKISGQPKFYVVHHDRHPHWHCHIKRYIEQLANVTFDKHLHENPSMVDEVKKTKINDTGKSFGKTKTEKLDNVTTQEGLSFFKQARRHHHPALRKLIQSKSAIFLNFVWKMGYNWVPRLPLFQICPLMFFSS